MDEKPTWEFTCKYWQDNPGAPPEKIKKAYQELLKTQGKQLTFIGRIEEQRGEEFEYCYWFCAILQERQFGVISKHSRARLYKNSELSKGKRYWVK